MNGVHDMGGMECFGFVKVDHNEPLFHADWEPRVLALTIAMGATGTWNLDSSRFARESLPPNVYLSVGYYRIWLAALEKLLLEHELITADELAFGSASGSAATSAGTSAAASAAASGKPAVVNKMLQARNVSRVLAKGAPVDRPATGKPLFATGDRVEVRNRHIATHTRLPAYLRGNSGVVHKVHGCHVFPDSNATGQGENPRWLYNVRFDASELWGQARPAARHVHVDCWEPYLKAGKNMEENVMEENVGKNARKKAGKKA